ncbi:3-phosphoshikimate 1-carboxyvinyltransferase [Aliikangiella marina]|uniref:3-phosphoshikimate 1-carboxyvinyltransferase n=1 Tax=Aliikangiella marina TaxID=1712262 RepID=UPI00163DD7F4|nr:3-phosphoshikimate 1-carboxyvinyltransferase [Aliikangiella marina]
MNLSIKPCGPVKATVTLPGSKYIANRLLPLCALASTTSHIKNVVNNDDIQTAAAGLSQLGYQIQTDGNALKINPRQVTAMKPIDIYTAHSGTFSRFVAAIAALEKVPVNIECSAKMATRPMIELFDALRSLSVEIDTPNGCLPAKIIGPVKGNECRLDASRSSQYLSALLIIAPLLDDGLRINLTGSVVSRAYVDMTIQLMKKMSVNVEEDEQGFYVPPGQKYQGIDFMISPDPVSSSYFMGAAAISGGEILLKNFDKNSLQGEAGFYQVLEKMGCKITFQGDDLLVEGPERLQAISIDMGGMPDAVQTLAVVACFAQGITTITNIEHLAFKESNRIEDTANELRKTGIKVESGKDYLKIEGGIPHGANIETHDDHRMAMSMALLGIKTPDICILDSQVVAKSFPKYWDYLADIGISTFPQTKSLG